MSNISSQLICRRRSRESVGRKEPNVALRVKKRKTKLNDETKKKEFFKKTKINWNNVIRFKVRSITIIIIIF